MRTSRPLGIISDIFSRFEVLRELDHVHKSINDAILLGPEIIEVNATTALFYKVSQQSSGAALMVNTFSGAITVYLPAPAVGLSFIVKDSGGAAASNNITISRIGSTEKIDGANSITISTNYQAKRLISDGTNWFTV
jgi:hypothetical protein